MTTTFSEPATMAEIGGHAVRRLAEQFGTPCYVYDAGCITDRIAQLRCFDVIRYAQKACSNLAIVSHIRQQGALVDTVSAGEIRRALAAGFVAQGDPPPIVYTADIFDRESLQLVVEQGVHVNCGSLDMLDQYGQRTGGGEITVRINPGFGHGHSQKTNTGGPQSKHGIWHEQVDELIRRADKNQLRITGLHMHIGSGSDMAHLGQVGEALERVATQIGPSISTISAGGGLPVPYKVGDETADIPGYFQIWDAIRRRLAERFGRLLRLEIEPGRFLVAQSGNLVTEIRAVKRMGDNLFYLVDAGFNDLARPILYGAYHPMAIVPATGSTEPALADVIVGGPLCESGDIFTQQEGGFVASRRLPVAQVGDLLVIRNAGAYGAVMGSNYNSKPLAPEVLLLGDKAHLVRARQSFQQIVQGESIPPELS